MTQVCHSSADQAVQRSLPFQRRTPFISIVVPVRNEAAFIRRTLNQLLDQTYDPERFEILVADGRSTDDTAEIVRELSLTNPQVKLLDNPGGLSSRGRNRAIRYSQGDLIVVIDGHCDLSNRDYLREVVAAFDRSGADCLGRPQPLDVRDATPFQKAVALARSSWLGHQPESCIYSSREGFVRPQSVAIAYRREAFERVGLFDERFDACEDVELNHRVDRAQLRCFFSPRLTVRYHPRGSLAALFNQMARYGRGRTRLLQKHPDSFSPACFVPALFVLGLMIGPIVGLADGWLMMAYLGVVALYLAVVCMASAGLARTVDDGCVLAWLPCVFVAIHIGAGWGSLEEVITGLLHGTSPAAVPKLEPRVEPLPEQPRLAA